MRGRSNFGWLKLIEGILLLVLGIYTLTRPDQALTGFIILYGIVAVITGISDIILYVQVARFTGFGPVLSLITGTLSVMAGVMLIITPNAGKCKQFFFHFRIPPVKWVVLFVKRRYTVGMKTALRAAE